MENTNVLQMQDAQKRKYASIQITPVFKVYQEERNTSLKSPFLCSEIDPKETQDYAQASEHFELLKSYKNGKNVYFEELLINEKNEIVHTITLEIAYTK